MNITYQLTLNEYQEAILLHYKNTNRPLIISIFAGFATFFILLGTDFDNTREVIDNMLVVFFSLSFYILFTRIITAYQAKRVYTKSHLLSCEVTLHLSGKGINLNRQSDNKTLPWTTFIKWIENDKYAIVYTSRYHFNVIPKRAMGPKENAQLQSYFKKYLMPV